MILIGSKAIKHHFPDFPREPKDTDYAVQERFLGEKKLGVEYLENPVLFNKGFSGEVLDKDALCTLKASHLCWNINWDKHMFDLQFLLKKGCHIQKDLFLELYNYWNVYHEKNKRSDLKMSKEDFFTNKINYGTNEHDFIHTILNPTPIYTKILKDGCEVELDEIKYNNLSFDDKLDLVREEVMNMAYERYSHLDYRIAYSKMLKKFIISHAPLYTLPFIFKHYIELHKPKINFIKKINHGLQENQLNTSRP